MELELTHKQEVTNNRSVVSYVVRVKRIANYNDNWTPISGGSYTTLTIGGQTALNNARHNWTTSSNNYNHTAVVASGSVNVPHDANGKKVIAYSLNFNANVASISNMANVEISGSFTAPDIPRVSKATLSKTSFNFSEYVTLTTNRASNTFTHKVSYIDGASNISINASMGDSGSFLIPASRMNSHPSSTSVPMTIRVITVSGGVDIGTHDIAVTVNVPASVIPTVGSLALAETVTAVSNVFSANTQYVSGVSRMKATAGTFAGAYGSTISRYYFEISGMSTFATNSTSSSVTLPVFNFPSSGSVAHVLRVRVLDSRGRYSAWRNSGTFRVHAYKPPVVSNPEVIRLSTPTTLQVTRSFGISLLNEHGSASDQKNTASYYIRTRKVGEKDWVTNTGAKSTATAGLSNSSANLAGAFSASDMWEVKAVVEDKLNTSESAVITVGTEFATMEILKGTGIGVGKAPVAGQGNLQVGTAGISSEGPLKATTLDVTGSGGNIQPLNTIYNPTNGVLIDICGHHTINMITVYVQGHGYGHMPINSIFQTYHYDTIGSFMNTRQMNFGHALPTGTFFVHGTRIKLWIPPTAAYKTFTITATGMNGAIYNVGLSNSAFPGSITYRSNCQIHKSWNEENHGSGSGLDADLLDGKHASAFALASNTTSYEFGSNDNGNYHILGNGLMICTQRMYLGNYLSGFTIMGRWTFPSAFKYIPTISVTPRTSWGNMTPTAVQEDLNGTLQLYTESATYADMAWFRTNGNAFVNGSKKYIALFAIGVPA